MSQLIAISLIVPTRGRPTQLRRFLASVAATASRPDQIEVILVTDEDDPSSSAARHPQLAIRSVVGPPGRTMGALNGAGYAASTGKYVMLLNDDVVVRTRGWDRSLLRAASQFPDGITLIHVNDTLIRDHLCTFPFVSRRFCELAGGICPHDYQRYRIDDHIEDVFNLLAWLGRRRTVYLPDVVFEHLNAVEHPTAGRVYESDPGTLAADAPRFLAHFPARKELALRLLEVIDAECDLARKASWRAELAAVADPFSLRTPGRQIVIRAPFWKRHPGILARLANIVGRVRTRYRLSGLWGLIRALIRRALIATTIASRPVRS
jgi:glycosyltransferase involved in cell wall biosynthesis